MNEILTNIVNEIFEEMEGKSSNEDQPLFNNDCISNENLTKISKKIVDNSQISALSGRTNSALYVFYYSTGRTYAASCMIDLRYVRMELISAI